MVLLEWLRRHAARREILVFTGFRQTLDGLVGRAAEAGVDHAVYHGSLPRAAKEQVISAFRDDVPVLLSTESAGEGRNGSGHALIDGAG